MKLDTAISTKALLLKRLGDYWKIERLNAFLIPPAAINVVVFVFDGSFTLAFALSLLATVWLLVVGTISLRMLLKNLERDFSFSEYWLPKLHVAQLPSLLLVVASIMLTLLDSIRAYPKFTASHYGAITFTLLAVLEYINYYHRQLQHFDNVSDFNRLMTGNGFRESHLARSLGRWRKDRKQRRLQARATLRKS